MKNLVIFLTTVLVISVVATSVNAAFVTDNLALYLNAADDADGSDGWTTSAAGTQQGTLGLMDDPAATAPTKMVEGSAHFFRSDAEMEAFVVAAGDLNPVTSYGQAFSAEVWMRRMGNPHTNAQGEQHILRVSRQDLWPGGGYHNYFSIDTLWQNNDTINVHIADSTGNTARESHVSDVANMGFEEWHQFVFTYESPATDYSGVLKVYKDAALVSTTTGLNTRPDISGDAVRAASMFVHWCDSNYPGQLSRTFNGDIAIMRFYTDLLTDTEIAQNFDDSAMAYGIPEPATIVLLGLGGLTLLKRRRQA